MAQSYSRLLTKQEHFIDENALSSHLTLIASQFQKTFHENQAVEASKDFTWPPDVKTKNLEELRASNSLIDLIRNTQQQKKTEGFNPQKVFHALNTDQEFDKVMSLATNGIIIDTPDDFIPQRRPEKMRPLHRKLINVMRMQALKKWNSKKVLIFPLTVLDEGYFDGIHFSPLHWTPKPTTTTSPGDPLGRTLLDATNGTVGSELNSGNAKDLAILRYNKVDDPLINYILFTWIQYCEDNNFRIKDCLIWKDDIEAAFEQLLFNPTSSLLMASQVDDELFMIQIQGNFGPTGIPMAFNLPMRALKRRISTLIDGVVEKYVDDFMGLSHHSTALSDQIISQKECDKLWGINSVSKKKTVSPTSRADILGWTVDLNTELVRPSDRGIDKLLFAFFFVDTSRPQTQKMYQLLASLAERYSNGIVCMKPFVRPLHHMVAMGSGKSKFWTRLPNSAAIFCIEMWRVTSIHLWLDRDVFSVPLRVMAGLSVTSDLIASSITISDAGPTQIAAAITSDQGICLAYTTFPSSFEDPDNLYQNLREYLGFLLSLLLTLKYKSLRPSASILWTTDSTTALSWAELDKCKTRGGQFAHIAVTCLQRISGLSLHHVELVPGISMGYVDSLSRNKPTPNLSDAMYIDLYSSKSLRTLFMICNPIIDRTPHSHHSAFQHIHALINSFLNEFDI